VTRPRLNHQVYNPGKHTRNTHSSVFIENSGENGADPAKPAPVSYIPPEEEEGDESSIYKATVSSGINFSKFDDIPVRVTGENKVPPMKSFAESGLRPFLLEVVAKLNYLKPTPIQKHAIPIIMNGRDVMACAQTGSGKTAAFLLPIIHNLLENLEDSRGDGEAVHPQAVILSPTRELAIQTSNTAKMLVRNSAVKTCIAYGGVQVRHQVGQLMVRIFYPKESLLHLAELQKKIDK